MPARGTPVAVLAACLSLSGCTLPYDQLALPGPITGSTKPETGAYTTTKGAALSKPGSPDVKDAHIYEGTGQFAKAPGSQAPAQSGDAGRPGQSAQAAPPSGTNGSGNGAAQGSKAADGSITLNLSNATISDAARIVLGESLGLNYIVSDRVKGNITLRTVNPVDKAGLIEIFDAILRNEGAALVAEGNIYRVVPVAEAGTSVAPLRMPPSRGGRRQLGLGTELLPLRYVSAVEMERILRSAAPQASILRVDMARNLLIIAGTQAELASLNELAQTFDVDWMRGMSFAMLPVETADTDAIAQELDIVFANDKDSPTKGIVRFIPNRRLKSILVISSRPEYLKKAETWLRRIDLASKATEKQVHVYHVQHRPANELSQLLQKVYQSREGGRGAGGGSSTSRGTSTVSTVPATDGISQPPSSNGGGSGTGGAGAVATPNIQAPSQPSFGNTPLEASRTGGEPAFGDAGATTTPTDSARTATGGGLPPDDRAAGISIVADEINNSLVITATSSEFKRMRQILQSIDIPSNQVLLEATIAEVTLNDNLKFGMRWFLKKGASTGIFTDSAIGAVASTFPGFSYFMNFPNLQVVLSALSAVTDVNIVSSPSMMVVENKKAVLQVGDEVPIATQSAVSVGAPGAPIVNSVSYRSAGIILGITPRVSDDGRVMLEIEQEVSDVVPTTSSTINSPTIQQRRIKTSVTVRDGETIVLAGLMQDRATRTRDQVPILGNIPLIGNVFKNKDDTIKRTELLISITPQVVRDSNQIAGITSEFRDKLNLSTRPQRTAPPDLRENVDRIVR